MAEEEATVRARCARCGRERTPGGAFCPYCGTSVLDPDASTIGLSAVPSMVGAVLGGKFAIHRELGRGSFGVVYEARDTTLDRLVAIKAIRADAFTSSADRAEFEKRFSREAKAVARLSHPNIVALYEVGQDPSMSFLAMELVRGRTLRSILADGGAMPVEKALPVVEALCAALDHAHGEGLVHRDIKPENVMIRDDGILKVADLGVAKALHEGTPTLTQAGAVLGTPSYMAPEQLQGKPIDGRADQFSAAAVAYEILTGRKPFQADSIPAQIYRILHESPAPPHTLNPTVPRELSDAIARGLEKDPTRRFVSCSALARAMRAGAAGVAAAVSTDELPPTPAASEPPVAAETSAGRRSVRPAVLLGAVAFLGLLVALWRLPSGEKSAPVPPNAPSAGKGSSAPASGASSGDVEELRKKWEETQRQLDEMRRRASPADIIELQPVLRLCDRLRSAFDALDSKALAELLDREVRLGEELQGRDVIKGVFERDFQSISGSATPQSHAFTIDQSSVERFEDDAYAFAQWTVSPYDAEADGSYELVMRREGAEFLVAELRPVRKENSQPDRQPGPTASAALRRIEEAFRRQDVNALVGELTKQPTLQVPGLGWEIDREQLRSFYQASFSVVNPAPGVRTHVDVDIQTNFADASVTRDVIVESRRLDWVVGVELLRVEEGWRITKLRENPLSVGGRLVGVDDGGPAAEEEAAAEPAGDEGVLSVASSPTGAEVYVDGELEGVTPLDVAVTLREPHAIRIHKEGRKDHVENLTQSEPRHTLTAILEPAR